MKTIRLPDPFVRGKAAHKLEWGTSAWAADSCLVEWSTLEREWLGVPNATEKKSRASWSWPNRNLLPAGGVFGFVLLAAALAWYLVD